VHLELVVLSERAYEGSFAGHRRAPGERDLEQLARGEDRVGTVGHADRHGRTARVVTGEGARSGAAHPHGVGGAGFALDRHLLIVAPRGPLGTDSADGGSWSPWRERPADGGFRLARGGAVRTAVGRPWRPAREVR